MKGVTAEELSRLLEKVRDITCIVEGKNDKLALERLGFSSVEMIDRALFDVVERFPKGAVVQILTDLDSEGRSLYKRLYSRLTQRGVKIDNRLRELLFGTELTHIEGFYNYFQRISKPA